MFTDTEKELMEQPYFTVIRRQDNFYEIRSHNTKDSWIICKESFDSYKPVTIYHKHRSGEPYFHKHLELNTVNAAIKAIKCHDCAQLYSMKNKWMREKGSARYGMAR